MSKKLNENQKKYILDNYNRHAVGDLWTSGSPEDDYGWEAIPQSVLDEIESIIG